MQPNKWTAFHLAYGEMAAEVHAAMTAGSRKMGFCWIVNQS